MFGASLGILCENFVAPLPGKNGENAEDNAKNSEPMNNSRLYRSPPNIDKEAILLARRRLRVIQLRLPVGPCRPGAAVGGRPGPMAGGHEPEWPVTIYLSRFTKFVQSDHRH